LFIAALVLFQTSAREPAPGHPSVRTRARLGWAAMPGFMAPSESDEAAAGNAAVRGSVRVPMLPRGHVVMGLKLWLSECLPREIMSVRIRPASLVYCSDDETI